MFLALCGLLLVTQGPRIFYRGERIGRGGQPFYILKFRTLCAERAKLVTADRTLPADANIETPMGAVMRETRLDEIPQLINIILGDMNICGPRPVRPAIAEIESQRIEGYATRFEVRPGLIGPAQALFGHSASKRLRARVNNAAVRRPVSIWAEVSLLTRIGLAIVERLSAKFARRTRALFLAEKQPARRDIRLIRGDSGESVHVDRIGLNDLSLRSLDLGAGRQTIEVRMRTGGLRRARIDIQPSAAAGVFQYEAADEVSAFVIERYALARVVIPPAVARAVADAPVATDLVGEAAGA